MLILLKGGPMDGQLVDWPEGEPRHKFYFASNKPETPRYYTGKTERADTLVGASERICYVDTGSIYKGRPLYTIDGTWSPNVSISDDR